MEKMMSNKISLFILIIILFPFSLMASETLETDWPGFRGRSSSGIAEGYTTPVKWNVESGENILWKVPIPGLAYSSPIVSGDSIFLTSALSEDGDNTVKVGLYGDIKPVEDKSSYKGLETGNWELVPKASLWENSEL